ETAQPAALGAGDINIQQAALGCDGDAHAEGFHLVRIVADDDIRRVCGKSMPAGADRDLPRGPAAGQLPRDVARDGQRPALAPPPATIASMSVISASFACCTRLGASRQ